MLQAAGFQAELKSWERGAYDNMKATGDYQGKLFLSRTAGIDKPREYLLMFHSRVPVAQNSSHVKDPELDKLSDAFAVAVDEARARDLARQIQFRLLYQAHVLQAPVHYAYSIAQPCVKGFVQRGDEQVTRLWAEKVWLDR